MRTLCCDVGSTYVRVAILEYGPGPVLHTRPLAVANRRITIYNPRKNYYEQRTADIWQAFCGCVRECRDKLPPRTDLDDGGFPVDSLAFAATCSLVIIEDAGQLNPSQNDVIMWMDHRATGESEAINQTGHEVLRQFGGICSPEFSLAKLCWLYRHARVRFDRARAFMELSDWITYRCSEYFEVGQPEKFPRSQCCVTCKWGYDSRRGKWRTDLFDLLGMKWSKSLEARIGRTVVCPGVRVAGLTAAAAREIGFEVPDPDVLEQVALSSSIIDAHSSVLAMLIYGRDIPSPIGCPKSPKSPKSPTPRPLNPEPRYAPPASGTENVLCMICSSSTCYLVLSKDDEHSEGQKWEFIKGIWGPYYNAIIPGYYLHEAGQSATGKLIERIIGAFYNGQLPRSVESIVAELNQQLEERLATGGTLNYQNALIVNPNFHGNRSPIANPHLKGGIYGFTMHRGCLLDFYVATIEALAYETRLIIEELERHSKPIRKIIVTGDLVKNRAFMQIHADILGLELVTFSAAEADLMLVGVSVLAHAASQIDYRAPVSANYQAKLVELYQQLRTAPEDRGFLDSVRIFRPEQSLVEYHQTKYLCYRRLLDACIQIEDIMLSGMMSSFANSANSD